MGFEINSFVIAVTPIRVKQKYYYLVCIAHQITHLIILF